MNPLLRRAISLRRSTDVVGATRRIESNPAARTFPTIPSVSSAGKSFAVVCKSGNPAGMNGMKAICFFARCCAKVSAMDLRAGVPITDIDDRGGRGRIKNDRDGVLLWACTAPEHGRPHL